MECEKIKDRERDKSRIRKYRPMSAEAKARLKQYPRNRAGERRSHLATYNLTESDYAEMLASQRGVCAICGMSQSSPRLSADRLAVDHCHTSGEIRGLLCNHCNLGLGIFRESIPILRNAMRYLALHHKKQP